MEYDDTNEFTVDDDDESQDFDDESDETIPCPNCGQEMYEDAERCPHCGEYVSDASAASSQPKWVVVTVAICLLIVLMWLLRSWI